MKTRPLSPIEELIAKSPQKRTAIEQAIVTAYRNGDPQAEKAAVEWLHSPKRWSATLTDKPRAAA